MIDSMDELNDRLEKIEKRMGAVEQSNIRMGRIILGDEDLQSKPILERMTLLEGRVKQIELWIQRGVYILIGYGLATGGAVAVLLRAIGGIP